MSIRKQQQQQERKRKKNSSRENSRITLNECTNYFKYNYSVLTARTCFFFFLLLSFASEKSKSYFHLCELFASYPTLTYVSFHVREKIRKKVKSNGKSVCATKFVSRIEAERNVHECERPQVNMDKFSADNYEITASMCDNDNNDYYNFERNDDDCVVYLINL